MEKIEGLKHIWESVFFCLGGAPQGKKDWLSLGGEEGNLLSPRQVESWIMTGGATLPPGVAFSGSMEEFIALFPKSEIERSKALINQFLQGVVAEYSQKGWEIFTCNVVVMGCCMGEYFSVANKKEY